MTERQKMEVEALKLLQAINVGKLTDRELKDLISLLKPLIEENEK